jgi:RHS repeat-associated protein
MLLMRGSTTPRAIVRAVTTDRPGIGRPGHPRTEFRVLSLLSLFLVSVLTSVLSSSAWAMPAPGGAEPRDPAVAENTGEAKFRIPIEVPPGPGGLTPGLTLQYSSRRGDGPYGVGWNLELGEVRCSTRFGVPDYANCERFELNDQLLAREGTSNVYHSFVETFQRIEYLSSSQSWQVTNPNGTILRYGIDPDSRVQSGPYIARWLLSEIQDPFGNLILITYDETTDPGTRTPLRVTYGAGATKAFGKRQIDFVFADRPDPIHDYSGGIERQLTKRLTEIKVSSYGELVRRYAFGYSLPSVDYTTGRSRLSWVQQFGSDCTGAIIACTGLPRLEYEYTDPNDTGTTDRFSKFDVDENYVVPFSGNGHLGVPPVRIGDVNGDGLPDLIKGGYYVNGFQDATVELNTGTGFLEDPTWTAALRNLQVDRPRADFNQIWAGPTEISNDNVGLFEATFSISTKKVTATPLANPSRPFADASFGAKALAVSGEPMPGFIEAVGRMYFSDVDSDGLADILVSVHLSGVDKVLDDQGKTIPPIRVPGRTVSVVYRNTGTGWVKAPDLAIGLPLFDEVIFESTYAVDLRDPWFVPDYLGSLQRSACGSRGLRGWERFSSGVEWGEDVCIDLVNFDPIFTDFNGDGFQDLMVLELDDPESLYRGAEVWQGDVDAPWRAMNFGKSRAWVQVPDAAAGEPRWIRATEYDLPSVDFGAPYVGLGYAQFNPFAHSELGRRTGVHTGQEDSSTGTCSVSMFAACAPTSYNRDNGVRLLDLNRDGLTDVIWSLYSADGDLITQGVLLNTGSGWCASTSEMATHVESLCTYAAMFYPPPGSPTVVTDSNGFALHEPSFKPPGHSVGQLVDLNSDGWLDFLQLQIPPVVGLSSAWLYNPDGASLNPPNVWVRDSRYDVDVTFRLLEFATLLDGVSFAFLDVNGDGSTDVVGDILRDARGGSIREYPQAFISNSKHSDLIKLVRNGRGGEIAISYESAIVQRDASLGGLEEKAEDHAFAVGETLIETVLDDVVRWTSTPVVSEVRIAGPNRKPGAGENGFGPPSKYRYAHPRFCVKNRSDLGFRIVERTRPGGETVTSSFYQVHGRAGKTSRVRVSENGAGRHIYREYWETPYFSALLPQPAGRPLVPASQPGSIDDPDVHVGRLAQVRWYNLYGTGTGGQTVRTLHYDDSYGYNFANKIVEGRPTGTLTTLRIPGSDVQNSIFGLPIEEKVFDWALAGFNIGDQNFVRHTLIDYQLGRPSSSIGMVKRRDETGPGTAASHSMSYDSYGNLSQQIVHAPLPSGDRVTSFCYDGDQADGVDGCPDFGQDSHSVRTGVLDARGGITSFEPDTLTGAIVGTQSTYTDEPSTSVDLDSFGRPVETFISSDDLGWTTTSKTVYGNTPFEPLVMTRFDYPEAGADDGNAIWSSVVSDGFGGTWKEIGKTPTGYVATLTYHDPSLRTVRKSLPIACPDASCAAHDGDSEPFAMLMETDAIGRPIREDMPHGFSILEYSSTTKTGGPGSIGSRFDSVLEKNGKGDVIQRAVDGNRIAWVDECQDPVLPSATRIGSCSGPETTHTYYSYEATGEVGTIYDARAAASSFSDPNHYLRYHYDTLGRVLQIDDPALKGAAGHTLTTYDVYGNIEKVTNARSEERVHSYDELGRLKSITTPSDETNYTVSYRPNEKQPSGDASDDYVRTRTYDALGRVQQESLAVRSSRGALSDFYTDYTYDLLGRVTEVVHPAKHYDEASGSWLNTIVRYEYDGAFLRKICDLGNAPSCDTATTEYVSSVGFDDLGRRTSLVFPGGTRTFSYNPEHRLTQDSFSSAGSYAYTRNYTEYDGIGNILSITGSESATQALDMFETYDYDERNRIKSWTKEGTLFDFDYDNLGNLILHGGEGQDYAYAEQPHAVKTRDTTSSSPITYTYDDDGNVNSILGGPAPQYFEFDSANQIVCLGPTDGGCETRVAYDVNGKRVAEYPPDRRDRFYIGDAFLYQNLIGADLASVEVMLDGERIALKRFRPQRRGPSTASLFVFSVPPPWIAGSLGCVGVLLVLSGLRNGTLVLVQLRPLRAANALTAAGSLLLPSIVMACVPTGGSPPQYYWEISDPLGTGMVMLDVDGERVRHQVFTPFGRTYAEVGANFRTFYAGHRRDDDSGMFYMQARWYDPGAGRFLSIDPMIRSVAIPQSANPYSYAENNPISGFDSGGRCVSFTEGVSGDLDAAEFTVGAGNLNVGGLDAFSSDGISGGAGAGGFSGSGPSVGLGGFSSTGAAIGNSLSGLSAVQGSNNFSVGVSGTAGSTVGQLGPVPVGGFVTGAIDENGGLKFSGGVGIAAGNMSITTAEVTASVNAGDTGGLELTFIAAGVIPFTRIGGSLDTRVSLDGFGARASLGGVAGRGGLAFLGLAFPLGESVDLREMARDLTSSGSGIPGNPGPPPLSAIPPF